MAINPTIAEPIITNDWITPLSLSIQWRYTIQQVRSWCRSGFLIRRGFTVYQDHHRRWWIRPPSSPQSPPRHVN